jgi:hypothetical protein
MAKALSFIMIFAAFSFESLANPIDKIMTELAKGEEALCSKGNFSKFKLTIRSFKGKQCETRIIASLAEMICPLKNFDNYLNSKCHHNAIVALNGQSATTVFLDEIKKNASKYETIFCPYIASVCNAINTARSYVPF